MSRAFVRENDGSEVPEDLPERPVSAHPNFVTAHGLKQIESTIRELESVRAAARQRDDKDALGRTERDLRYWLQRKATAKLVEPAPAPDKVRFGVRVTVRDADGQDRRYTLVGEDEAEPAQGSISWISPIAQALLGASVGDEVRLQDRNAEVVRIDAATN